MGSRGVPQAATRDAWMRAGERAEEGQQFVVISLKDTFYEKAQGLVGVFRDRAIECSRSVTLDLDKVAGAGA